MCGHIGGHTDGYTRSSVDKKVGETCREHHRLHTRIVIVGLEVYSVTVYIREHLLAETREPYLGITHGGRAVTVNRTEVSVSVYKAVAHGPRLGETDNGAVD